MAGRWISALPRSFLLLCMVAAGIVAIHLLYGAAGKASNFYGYTEVVSVRPLVVPHETMVAEVERSVPSLPLARVLANRGRGLAVNDSCAPFPDIYDLQLTNTHWQTTNLGCSTVQMFGAYFDNRTGEPVVRILAMVNPHPFAVQGHCQMWFNDNGPHTVVPVSAAEYLWHWQTFPEGAYHPYLMTCRVPKEHKGGPPSMVSLVNNPCEKATNVLRVHDDRPAEKKDFAVCVRGLLMLNDNFAVRLVEWLELVRILGADKVFIYLLHVHETIDRVLKYYVDAGLVLLKPIISSGRHLNHPLLQDMFVGDYRVGVPLDEIIQYNDCIYRNHNTYRYVALMDVDEVIIPAQNETWWDMVDAVMSNATAEFRQEPDSLCASNTYFFDEFAGSGERFDDLPRGAHILRHVRRSRLFSPKTYFSKCLHNVGRVLASHTHYPLECLWPPCKNYEIDHDIGRLQHYRDTCQAGTPTSCDDYRNDTVEDTNVWRYRDRLVARVNTALREIGLTD